MIPRIFCLFTVGLVLISMLFGCKDQGATDVGLSDSTIYGPHVRKPNIYLYPNTSQRISVALVFPLGGRILESDPEYGTGWQVFVEPTGRINSQYNYLYYEAQVPDRYQYSDGWLISPDTVASFLAHIMTQVGFNRLEIADFLEYWVPRLNSAPAYEVYPQQGPEIDRMIRLKIFPVPQSQLRLFFVIRPATGGELRMTIPRLSKVRRSEYHISEWGVVTQ